MLQNVTIENYRGFQKFELRNLGRVNLIVGANNSGKTSILEAIDLLMSRGDVSPVARILARRGEEIVEHEPTMGSRLASSSTSIDIRRLFHGHSLHVGQHFLVSGTRRLPEENIDTHFQIRQLKFDGHNTFTTKQDIDLTSNMRIYKQLVIGWSGGYPLIASVDISSTGAISYKTLSVSIRPANFSDIATYIESRDKLHSEFNVQSISIGSLDNEEIAGLFDSVALTEHEDLVYDSLRIIEPDIQRIAPQLDRIQSKSAFRGGFWVQRKGANDRIPIGSLGDGIWRLLGLALSLVHAKGGVLLVDDIDTGLHYSVLEKMWQLVFKTAEKLDIQVFATTHSSDCYRSLASVCRDSVLDENQVTIQRVERNKTASVCYTEQEIIVAAEHGVEVR